MNDSLFTSPGSQPLDLLSVAGSLASILGLGLTIWVWLKVRNIEGHFLFRVRFPSLKRQLGQHCASISRHLNSFPESANDLEIELKKCQSDLKNLHSKLKGQSRASASHILTQIDELPSPLTADVRQNIREIHLNLVILEKDLENLKEDMQWRTNQ